MISFGLVTEGSTDQEVISAVLFGFFSNKDIPINELQPLRDETDRSRQKDYGGWGKLLEYCRSNKFREAFQFCEYVIIQIDTDVCEDYGISKKEEGQDRTANQLVEVVSDYLIAEIGLDFFNKVKNRVLFAISVHSIECWLLPLYYTDNRSKKIVNCLNSLNQQLNRQHSFTIDKDNKNIEYYQSIVKPFRKNRDLMRFSKLNPSFKVFISNLKSKNIILNE